MSKRRCWRNLSQVLEKQLFWSKLIEEKVVRCNFTPKITLCFKSPKCLRFYVHWFFIERSPISNFLICLINSIILLNKIPSVDQIFFTTFQGEGSKLNFWYWFRQFSSFSISSSSAFWIKFLSFLKKNDDNVLVKPQMHCMQRCAQTFWVVIAVMKANNSHPVVLRVCQDNQEINKDLK